MKDPVRTLSGTLATMAALALAGCHAGINVTNTPAPTIAPQLVPAPASLVMGQGAPFTIMASTGIVAQGDGAAEVAEALAAKLRPPTGFPLPATGENVRAP